VTDTARVLLTAGALSLSAIAALAWRTSRTESDSPERLIGELRLSQWAAILLAATGGLPMGLAIAGATIATAHLDLAIGMLFVGLAGLILQREPRQALLLATGGFLLHAIVDIAHRPGWLSPDLVPRWFVIGCASYDIVISAICYWARRR
jgi:hypothetical protein